MANEPFLGCKPGDGVVSDTFRPGVVHKVRFATPLKVHTVCWAWLGDEQSTRRVEEVPNCLDCIAR